jgi:hypothetical protein
MKELKQIALCVVPYAVAALMIYPLMAIVGGSTDPFIWERTDRMFYFVCVGCAGTALLARLTYVGKTYD